MLYNGVKVNGKLSFLFWAQVVILLNVDVNVNLLNVIVLG